MSENHLYSRLSAYADAQEDKPFARLPDGSVQSYGETFHNALRIAALLKSSGLEPGGRVAVQVHKSLRAIELYLGTVAAGGVFLPLNTAYTAAELEYFLGDATPSIVVVDPAREAEIAPIAGAAQLLTLDASGGGSLSAGLTDEVITPEPRTGDDLAAILYTSGTTGRSKGAMLSHDNLYSNSETLRDYWRFTDRDVLIHALPIFHTHGLFVATNVALLAGATLHFLPGFDAEAIIAAMPSSTALMGVPTFYTRLLAEPGLTPEAAAHMRLFVSGSAPLLAETHADWRARTGHAILERYGMTETSMNTSNPYEGERRPGTVGPPLPGVEVRVTDAEGNALPAGEVGGLEVRGPNVFKGYWRMPEKTAEEFRDGGWFVTGDLAEISEDGYVSIVGRAKDLVISGGYNVYPKEVESLIDEIEGVAESAVIGLPHPDFGEAVTAVVVPRPGAELEEKTILDALGDRLARYKQPKRVFLTDALPRNTMGKVQKNVLRDTYAGTYPA